MSLLRHQLFLHTSNQTEVLFDQLVELLAAAPPKPLTRLPFLIQGRGMERWLMQQLAHRFGVWASGEFLFPHAFFDRLAERLGLTLRVPALRREAIRWQIERLLRDPEFAHRPPLDWLLANHQPRQRFRLAEAIANLFDQYQIHRPDWLAAWQAGKNPLPDDPDAAWQAALWRALALTPHRGELWQQLAQRLEASSALSDLPDQLFVFGINFLPSLVLEVLLALSRHTVVHLFLLSPCETYWSDLPSQTSWRLAVAKPDGLPEGEHHPLLIAFGRQGAHFQQLLLATEEHAPWEVRHFVRHEPAATLTDHLVNDLASNQVTPLAASIEYNLLFHRCHTRLREVEALRDRIVALLRDHPEVTPNQIVVMSPSIEAYQPFIAACFADLPHTVADRSLVQEAPALALLTNWLDLVAGPLGWDAVWDFLHQPLVMARFGWRESDLEELERLVVVTAGLRCGLDDPTHRNHWRAAIDRLLLGAVFPSDGLWGDVAPLSAIEGGALAQLAPLIELLDLITAWRLLAESADGLLPAQWAERLSQFARFFFGDAPEGLPLFEAIDSWREETEPVAGLPIPLATVTAWAETLGRTPRHPMFLTNGITFCDLLPMRSVPVDYLFLLGMDDQRYPRANPSPSFDLMHRYFRLGDRDLRAEDRYTFLELLLSVRRRLEIFWQGVTPDTNEPLPAAAVIEELREVLANHYRIDLERLTITHRAYPFHTDYFRDPPGPLPAGEDPDHYAIVRALAEPPPKAPASLPLLLAANEKPVFPSLLPLTRLAEALADPIGWRLSQQGIVAPELPAPPPARPLLAPNGLSEWTLRERFAAARGNGDGSALLARMIGEGCWPMHPATVAIAKQWCAPLTRLIERFAKACPAWRQGAQQPEPEPIGLTLSMTTLTHLLNSAATGYRSPEGLVGLYPHPLRGEKLLLPWLQHLLVNAADAPQSSRLWLLRDKAKRTDSVQPLCLTFAPLDREEAKHELAAWVALLAAPPLWQKSVWREWAEAAFLGSDRAKARETAAFEAWQKESQAAFGLALTGKFRGEGIAPALTALCGPLAAEPLHLGLAATWKRIAPRLARWLNATTVTPLDEPPAKPQPTKPRAARSARATR